MAEPTIVTRIKFEGLDDIKSAFEDMRKSFESSVDRMRRAGEKVGDGLKKSIEGSTAAVRTTGTVGVRSFSLLKSAASGFLSILKSGVSLLVNLGKVALDVAGKVAAVGAGAFIAVQAFGVKTGQAIDEMGRLADAAGIPVDRFSRLATATRLLGGEVSDLGSGMQSLSERILDAAKDADGSGAKAFAQLGVSVRDSNGNLKSTEQVLNEVADGLARVPRDSLRASAATDIFGGSARALLPILERGSAGLEEYAKKSDRLGTVVTATQAKVSRDLLVKYRQVGEALRGIAFKIGDDLLPFLTQNSDKLSGWLADNAENISRFVGKVLREISGIAADLGKALVGDAGDIQREWVKKVVPAIATARDVLLDLLDLFTGGSATRAPWLREIGKALRDAGGSALALARNIASAAGFADTKLPTLQQAAYAVRDAFASLRAGIEGKGEIRMKWAASIGETFRNLSTIIGTVAGTIAANKDGIAQFASETTLLLSGAVSAISSLLKGEEIAEGNPFAFLEEWKATALAFYEEIQAGTIAFKEHVVHAYEVLRDAAISAYDMLDAVAKALGFENGAELGIVILATKLTGLMDILQGIAGIAAALVFAFNNFLGSVIKVGTIAKTVFLTVIQPAIVAVAAALGLPVAAVATIAAAIAALAVAVWYFWDDIVAACKWLWGKVTQGFEAMLDGIVAVWEGVSGAADSAWDAIVAIWDGFADWIAGLFDSAMSSIRAFWNWMTSAPGRAWDSLVNVWSGFTGFFSGLVDKVKGYFKGLWDGVKNGARDAWTSVKGWFGLGDDAPADGTADRSPRLATGGVVRGPGGPVGDKIRAWLSSGEGVLNARAVSHYGEGLVHALNGLLVPKTHFASGGIVGEMVPASAGAGLAALHLAIDGRRNRGGLYADGDAVRTIRRDFGKSAIASRGPLPRWRGA